jgi:FkbM family methyltransferase
MMKSLARQFVLKFLKLTQRDFYNTHHWVTGKKIKLNSFRHKGYWYHGKSREEKTMTLFGKFIAPGDSVVEVGGHIGYISTYFSHLVGPTGQVLVFEPGQNNLDYTRANVRDCKNIKLVEKGVGRESGVMAFYEDALTGQNNSFVKDFDGLKENQKYAIAVAAVEERKVDIVTLDSFLNEFKPDFIKIDVEGFELAVLEGARETLKLKPIVMVEVQADRKEIFEFMTSLGYVLFNESGEKCLRSSDLNANIFCLDSFKHLDKIAEFKN